MITYKILMHRLNVNVPEKEMEILRQYCEQEGRTQSDVLREYIRSLKRKLNKRIESSQ
ncbi:MAG: ribbon-helix-helix protein, CopG family [Snowella sp.]|nr:ribbon-helix-helix protein, CopG family [Snowella sp.]